METRITESNFVAWKNDPITKSIFQSLENIRSELNLSLTDANLIMAEREKLVRLLGQREGIDVLLQISADDIVEESIDYED